MLNSNSFLMSACLFAAVAGCSHPAPSLLDGIMGKGAGSTTVVSYQDTNIQVSSETDIAVIAYESSSETPETSSEEQSNSSNGTDDLATQPSNEDTEETPKKPKKEKSDAGRGNGDDGGDPGRSGDVNQGGDEAN